MLNVAVVSPDAIGRAALVKALQQTEMVRHVFDYSDAPSTFVALTAAQPEIVFLELSTEDPNPQFEVAAHLHRMSPAIQIVACSAQAEPDAALLMKAMRFGVREFMHTPVDQTLLREIISRFAQDRGVVVPKAPQKLIAVVGAKGGVGTTTVAVNLAVQAAQASAKRVVLLDLGRPFGHASLMLDLQPRFSLRDAAQNYDRLDSHLLDGFMTIHKSKLAVLAGIADPTEWSSISLSAVPRISEIAQANSDIVIADMGVHYTPEWLPMLVGARNVMIVSEAHVPSLWAVERQISALTSQGVPANVLRLVINRWHRRDEGVLKSVEQRTKRDVFLRLPNNFDKVNEAINSGMPLADNHDNAIVSRLRQFAGELAGTPVAARRGGGFSNLFSSHSK
ncbi:MAG: AAA family ATPase [Acidobacteriia bacterium]|nr:AAA family ATPase [Terriglobia bacterium]